MLKAIYKTGSSIFLEAPKDKDFVLYFETEEERREALIHDQNHEVDNHYCLIEKATKTRLGCYIYPMMELVEGEEIEALKNYNFLEHKEEYMALVKPYVAKMSKTDKRWYHLVVAYYMFSGEKTKLTKAQLEVVQNTHDKGISDNMYNKVVDYFNQTN